MSEMRTHPYRGRQTVVGHRSTLLMGPRIGSRNVLRPFAIASLFMAAEATWAAGDAARGLEWLRLRHETGCVLCHVVPGLPQGGDIGPPLLGLAARYGSEELAARIADARRFNPETMMPPYRSTEGLREVATSHRGRPILTEQMLMDIVSHLLSDAGTGRGSAGSSGSLGPRAATPSPASSR